MHKRHEERRRARYDKDRWSESSKRRIVRNWQHIEREGWTPQEEFLRELGVHLVEFQQWRKVYG